MFAKIPLPTILFSLCVGVPTAQTTLVIPKTLDGVTAGNANTSWPWNRTTSNPVRIQYCYDSTHFTDNGILGSVVILGMRFRAQETASSTWTGGTYANVVVRGGPAATDYAAQTTTFDSNWLGGVAPAPAFSGPVTVIGGSTSSTAIPAPWYVTIALSNPIVYDPATGDDFLLEVQNFAAWSGGTCVASDCGTVPTPLTTRMYNLTDANALTGTLQANVGLTCELELATSTTGPAFAPFALGCPGSTGYATIGTAMDALPVLGTTITFEIANAAAMRPAFVMLGFTRQQNLDLGLIGMTGCFLLTDIVSTLPSMTSAAGVASAPLMIPNDPGNIGLEFQCQGFIVDPGVNPFGAVLSHAATGRMGL